MRILGLKNTNINILTKDEMIENAKAIWNKQKNILKGYDLERLKENWEKLQSEPMPYSMFRYNEIHNYRLNFVGCEINEEQYMNRLECLPPVPFKADIYKGYIVPECITENRYEHIFEHNGVYYCVIMPAQSKNVENWF